MQDREVFAAIVAGDPRGIAEAYDTYAMPLYSYCRSLLREPEDAADAVQDTFLIATAKLGGLRDPGKLRSWLYAVARNECYRRLRSGEATSALDEAVDLPAAAGGHASTAESADVASALERAEVHQLVRDAINGLNPGEQDVIKLSLVQGLDHDELADALGVSRNHAHALQSRARSQLERSLGALIVARTGRGELCGARRPAGRVGRADDAAAAQAGQPARRPVRDLRRAQTPRADPGPVRRRAAAGRAGAGLP